MDDNHIVISSSDIKNYINLPKLDDAYLEEHAKPSVTPFGWKFSSALDYKFDTDIVFPKLKEKKDIGKKNSALGIEDDELLIEHDSEVTVKFVESNAGYKNTLGKYEVSEDGTIQSVNLIFENAQKTKSGSEYSFVVEPTKELGFFIIADGYSQNKKFKDLSDESEMKFIYDLGGKEERLAKITDDADDISLVAVHDGKVTVLKGEIYHSTIRGEMTNLNPDGEVHAISGVIDKDNPDILRVGFEDLKNLGDSDFNDLIFDVVTKAIPVDGPVTIIIKGTSEDDILVGTDDDNLVLAYEGDDVIVASAGDDVIRGGLGSDTIDYSTMTTAVVVSLFEGTADKDADGIIDDDLDSVENVVGTDFNDDIFGSDAANILEGGAGDDLIRAAAGDDTVYGGAGHDEINGNEGHDTLYGGDGNDRVGGNDGNDVIHGDAGDDMVYGHRGNDTLYGDAGNDRLEGGQGDDLLFGGEGDDVLLGQDGSDELHGGIGVDQLYGGAGDDIIYGDEGDDFLYGGIDNDTLHGGVGVDKLYGEDGDDTLNGGDDGDLLAGGAGNDVLNGDAGNDMLLGQGDNDVLNGGAGDDQLYGGDGDDILIGGAGQDVLYGGSGNDTFAFDVASLDGQTDRVQDFTYNGGTGDMIDISDVLTGFTLGESDISDFVVFFARDANTAVLKINVDGQGNDFITIGLFAGSDMTGITAQDLIDNGTLIANQILV